MQEFIITQNDAGQRADKFLIKTFPGLSKGMLYKAIRTKNIKINKRRITPEQFLVEGDLLQVYITDDKLQPNAVPEPETPPVFLDAPTELHIIHEDENLLIVSKPVGLVVHTDQRQVPDCLIHRIQHYLYNKKEYNPDESLTFAPALCNRLDRNTGGIVIAAKNAAALREMNRLIRQDCIRKEYLCVVNGVPKIPHAVLQAWHMKSDHNTVRIADVPTEGYQEIRTEYTLLQTKGNFSLLNVHLITGRTHQIRAHLSHIGCPLLGDSKYGSVPINKKYKEFQQLLWAYRLTMPVGESELFADLDGKVFETPLPDFVDKYFNR